MQHFLNLAYMTCAVFLYSHSTWSKNTLIQSNAIHVYGGRGGGGRVVAIHVCMLDAELYTYTANLQVWRRHFYIPEAIAFFWLLWIHWGFWNASLCPYLHRGTVTTLMENHCPTYLPRPLEDALWKYLAWIAIPPLSALSQGSVAVKSPSREAMCHFQCQYMNMDLGPGTPVVISHTTAGDEVYFWTVDFLGQWCLLKCL